MAATSFLFWRYTLELYGWQKQMTNSERLDQMQRYFSAMFPSGLKGGNLQSTRKCAAKNIPMSPRCHLYEEQLKGEKEIICVTKKGKVDTWKSYTDCLLNSRWDEYTTIHVISHLAEGEVKRTKDRFGYIGGINLDLDLHKDGVPTEELVSKTIEEIISWIKDGVIPMPNLFIHTGRGVALHYRYADMIEYVNDPVDLVHRKWQIHHRTWELICDRMRGLLGDVCEIDESVGDISRVMRVPGTLNTKVGSYCYIITSSESYFTPESLCAAFELDYETIKEDVESIPVKQKKEKKPKENSKNESAKKPAKTHQVVVNRAAFESGQIRVGCFGWKRYLKAGYIQMLDALFDMRDDWTGYRDLYAHIYYNLLLMLKSKPEADQIIDDVYAKLCDKSEGDGNGELEADVEHIKDYPCDNGYGEITIYDYMHIETIVKKLGITDEELAALGRGGSISAKKVAEEASARNEIRDKKRNLCKVLFLQGMKQTEISERVNEELGLDGTTGLECTYSYVRRYTQGLRKLSPDHVDLEARTAYVHGLREGDSATNCATFFPSGDREREEGGGSAAESECMPVQLSLVSAPSSLLEEAWEAYLRGDNLTVLGPGGSGKSTLIEKIKKDCEEKDKVCYVMAPTGLASRNVAGKTIISQLGLDADKVYAMDDDGAYLGLFGDASVLIVDELGNTRADHVQQIINGVRRLEKYTRYPIQIIWMGDCLQLSPVCTGTDWIKMMQYGYRSVWFFDLPEWEDVCGNKFVLTETYRITDKEYLSYVDKVRMGTAMESDIEWLNKNCSRERDDDAIWVVGTRKKVRQINLYYTNKNFQNVDKRFYKTTDGQWGLAVGMKVMVTRNNGSKYQNGLIGVICKLNEKSVRIRNEKGDMEVLVEMDGDVLPVVPAYAVTVHKSQGQTFESINVIPEFFEGGQLYTVLSRVHGRDGIHLAKDLQLKDVMVNQRALEYQYEKAHIDVVECA